jgi:hypothetical protein
MIYIFFLYKFIILKKWPQSPLNSTVCCNLLHLLDCRTPAKHRHRNNKMALGKSSYALVMLPLLAVLLSTAVAGERLEGRHVQRETICLAVWDGVTAGQSCHENPHSHHLGTASHACASSCDTSRAYWPYDCIMQSCNVIMLICGVTAVRMSVVGQ